MTRWTIALTACLLAGAAGAAEPARPALPKVARVEPVPQDTTDPELARRIAGLEPALARLNVVRTMMRNPKLFDSWQPFAYYILRQSTLPPRDREILINRIGWLNGSVYEFTQHVRVAKAAGLTDAEIERIKDGPDAAGWAPHEAALLRAVDQLRAGGAIDDPTWAVLAARYDVPQLMDVVVTTGQYNLISWYLNALGTPLEPGVVPQAMTR